MLHLTFLNQIFHRSRHVFDLHVRVDTVLIEQVDSVDFEPLERALGDLLDVLWPAIQALPTGTSVWIELEPELGGDHHLVAHRRKSFANELFVREWTIDLSRIEECYAAFHGRAEKSDHLLLVSSRTVRKAHSHAA